jgi:hypothetical protein
MDMRFFFFFFFFFFFLLFLIVACPLLTLTSSHYIGTAFVSLLCFLIITSFIVSVGGVTLTHPD